MPAIDPVALTRSHPGIWLESWGSIRGKQGKKITAPDLRLNIVQRRYLAVYRAAVRDGRPSRIIVVKPRKKGVSTIVGASHYTQLMNFPHEGIIVGNKLATSDIVFRMMHGFAETDRFKAPGWGSPFTATSEKIVWNHGSILSQATARGGDTIRGETPQFIHGTEAAHWEQAEEAIVSLMNAIPDEGTNCVTLESTPFGTEGPFAETWMNGRWPNEDECPDGLYWKQWESVCPNQSGAAIYGDLEFVRVFAAWYEFEDSAVRLSASAKRQVEATLDAEPWYHGERTLIELYANEGPRGLRLGREVQGFDVWEQLAWRRMTIKTKCAGSTIKMDEENPRDPASCFTASGAKVFDEDSIARLRKQSEVITPAYGSFNLIIPAGYDRSSWDQTPSWQRATPENAIFLRYEEPKIGCAYIAGADPAEGEDQSDGDDPDRHSGIVLRQAYRDARGVLHNAALVSRIAAPCRVPLYTFSDWMDLMARYYGRCPVVVEMNNSGLAVLTEFRHLGTQVWKRREWNKLSGKEVEKEGWRTHDTADYGGVRTTIINHLHEALRTGLLDIHDVNAIAELNAFVRKGKRMEAESGKHDDDVLSLAFTYYNIGDAQVLKEHTVKRVLPPQLQALMDKAQGKLSSGISQRW